MHNATQKEFEAIRDEAVCLVSFDCETLERTNAYGGISYIKAVSESLERMKKGKISIIAPMSIFSKINEWERENIKPFNRFMRIPEFKQLMEMS